MRKLIYRLIKRKDYQLLSNSRQNTRLSTADLENLRQQKFHAFIKHAKLNSPYYSTLLRDKKITGINDITKLPILTKKIIKKHGDSIISTLEKDKDHLKRNSTSGSTGAATYFYSDLRDKREARAIRGDEFVPNFNLLDKQLIFWGAERDVLSKKDIRYYFNRYIVGKKIISTYHLTKADIKKIIVEINTYKPVTIVGYPSALHFMALEIQKSNLKLKHSPSGIISAGETLQDYQRDTIEKVFKTSIYNRYGCREFGHIANECNAHSGYHYNADDLIVEVVDEEGEPCENGEIGKLLITDLNNYAFPMIRYEIGDLGSLSDTTICPCGSTLPKLATIEGRTFDIVHGLNGNKVSGTFWTLTFRNNVQGVDAFQIKQSLNYNIHIDIKTNKRFSTHERNKIQKLVKEKLGTEINVTIKEVAEFEYTATGKFKWITSELNNL